MGRAVAGAGTLWLLTHTARASTLACTLGLASVAGSAITLASSRPGVRVRDCLPNLVASVADLWAFVRTRDGFLVVLLCVIPFGVGTEAGLIGAISREWGVTPNQLAALAAASAASSVAGALFAGWLASRIGPWKTYFLGGWAMIAMIVFFAFAPRIAPLFVAVELFYRAVATGCYAALLGIVMTSIGKGAASTKAAPLWSLTNFAFFYPTLVEGSVHDHGGTLAMLLTDAGLATAGFAVLVLARRLLKDATWTVGVPTTLPLSD